MSDDLKRVFDMARALQRDLDKIIAATPPTPQAPIVSPPAPAGLATNLTEELRYILWRYGQDHTGEDHQERLRVATEWLASLDALAAQHLAPPPAPHWDKTKYPDYDDYLRSLGADT